MITIDDDDDDDDDDDKNDDNQSIDRPINQSINIILFIIQADTIILLHNYQS